MIEKTIELSAPLDLFGVQEKNLKFIRHFFPKVKIIARGHTLYLAGDDSEIERCSEKFELLIAHFNCYNRLDENDIIQIMDTGETTAELNSDEVLVHGSYGKQIKAMTVNQKKLVEACQHNDMVFAIGPAGSGKTYTAVALAVRALKNKEIRRIVLTRPAVEAGENLGFLPGDLRDKLDPYLQPLYDALRDMIPQGKLQDYLEDRTIEIAPLAFMRGRTLDQAFVILDEAQNATEMQIKMFLTRMGKTAKFIITGDVTQIDLPRNQNSGLLQALKLLDKVNGISIIHLTDKDVMRHRLVSEILKAYENLKKVNV
ncbi:phosphate starvation protein PhoH [Bacteroidia bacterium]|nr:phosphate starvation protein PhoH [Bacteroidia bacterium]